jgi:hypothetical protein
MGESKQYYYIAIDKQEKTIQLRKYQPNSCTARELKTLATEYNMTNCYPYQIDQRFTVFHNDTKNYIDYSTFYKKYAKYKVLEEVL